MFDDYNDCIDEVPTESADMTEEMAVSMGDVTVENTLEDTSDTTAMEDITFEMDDVLEGYTSLDESMEQNEPSFEEDFENHIDFMDMDDMREERQTLLDLQDLSGDEIVEKYSAEWPDMETDTEIGDFRNSMDTETDASLSQRIDDPSLFDGLEDGIYTYGENDFGKRAVGSLDLVEEPQRDQKAQRLVGAEDRRSDDDGGHLIGARFGGAGGEENLDAQNSNLNRGSYKQMENQWAEALESGDKVFVDVATYKSNGSDRPDAYLGYSIIEHDDGSRNWDAFSFQNESSETLKEWESTVEALE